MSPQGASAEAEELLALGFTALKIKIGRGDLAADLNTIRAVRRAVGEKVKPMVDYNQSISVAEAMDRVRVLDVMKLGGVTGWLRAAALAESAGLLASSHTFPEFSAHLLGVTPTSQWLKYLDHAGPILTEPIRIKDGYAVTPDRPGSGLEWNEDALEQWLV